MDQEVTIAARPSGADFRNAPSATRPSRDDRYRKTGYMNDSVDVSKAMEAHPRP
jgi:hypothetical protein